MLCGEITKRSDVPQMTLIMFVRVFETPVFQISNECIILLKVFSSLCLLSVMFCKLHENGFSTATHKYKNFMMSSFDLAHAKILKYHIKTTSDTFGESCRRANRKIIEKIS